MLKDASSTSIYGARAANGVVVITSKRGLAMDKAKVTLRGQWGFSQLASDDNWMMMNTPERIQFEKEIGLDAGKDYNLLSRTDVNWLDKVFNDRAPLQSYESVSYTHLLKSVQRSAPCWCSLLIFLSKFYFFVTMISRKQ